jgi:histone H3/H4
MRRSRLAMRRGPSLSRLRYVLCRRVCCCILTFAPLTVWQNCALLRQASIAKLVKRALGDSVQVGKEAKVSQPAHSRVNRKGCADTKRYNGACLSPVDADKSGGHLYSIPHSLVRSPWCFTYHCSLVCSSSRCTSSICSANDFCHEGRRTTINANDVLQALK